MYKSLLGDTPALIRIIELCSDLHELFNSERQCHLEIKSTV